MISHRTLNQGRSMTKDASNDIPLVELVKVDKGYPPDAAALRDISLRVFPGEIVCITGRSGAGKTTLLNLICCQEKPSKGLIKIRGRDISLLTRRGVQRMRQKIGVAWQDFKLLENLTVAQNIAMAMEVAYAPAEAIRKRISELLCALRIMDKHDKPVGELSRGEQQRVALARAAANGPALLLADEPSGNLDTAATELVLDLFKRLNKENGTTIIVATHDEALYRDEEFRVVDLCNGQLSEHVWHTP